MKGWTKSVRHHFRASSKTAERNLYKEKYFYIFVIKIPVHIKNRKVLKKLCNFGDDKEIMEL